MILHFKIKKDIDHVFTCLGDMRKFVTVHPIIWKVDHRGGNNYLVYEKLKIGFIPLKFTYPVTVEADPAGKKIRMRATVLGMTKVEMDFSLIAENEYTHVTENVTFKSPLPVKQIMEKIFREQHALLFQNIEKVAV